MTALDDRIRPRVVALISKYGLNATFEVLASAVPDATTGTVTETAATGSPFTAKISPPEPVTWQFLEHESSHAGRGAGAGGDVVRTGDVSCLVAAKDLAFTPLSATGSMLARTMTIDGIAYTIVKIEPIWSGEEVAAWRFFGRL